MTELNGWEQQSGGLWLKVSPYSDKDAEHRDAALHVMRESVHSVAQTHGASFNENGFRNNVRAISSGDLEVDLYLAKWEICQPKPIYLGAAFHWETYAFDSDGSLANSVYTEDVCLLKSKIRQLLKTRPDGKELPKESLAESLERISLDRMRNDGVIYRFGEVDSGNTAMMRQLNDNGAYLGTGANSGVLEIKRVPVDHMASWLTPVSVHDVLRGGVRNERVFSVQWKQDQAEIRFLVTKGRATALGKSRADIRPWHNGNLPDQLILDSVVASALIAIKREVEERNWGKEIENHFPLPMAPLSIARSEVMKVLYDAAQNEVGIGMSDRPASFGKPMPDAHVFVQNDKRMLKAFVANNAQTRFFGDKPMIPGVNILHEPAQLIV